ncbi:MAG: DegV family protein [Muricomes sp.]
MNIKITSDSTCDLSPELLEQYNISIAPLHVEKGGENFRDGIDIFPEDIFRHVDAGGELCKTSAVNPSEYKVFFEQFASDYKAVIHVTIGSGFSSCYQNAGIAAEEFENVFIVDSKNLSSGQGHCVMEAAVKAEEGCDAESILEHLGRIIPKIRASFLLDRLDYMAKGGRCSSVMALSANLLKLKPCIEVVDGEMRVVKKYRGSLQRCLVQYVEERLEKTAHIRPHRIFVTHTTISEEISQEVIDTIKKKNFFEKIYETYAGCTISSHCGQNTLGILYIEQ